MTLIFASEPHVVVHRDGVSYTLIGTAHVSQKSADVVSAAVRSGHFDAVAVELCVDRKNQMFSDPKIEPSLTNQIKTHGFYATVLLRSMKRLYGTLSKKTGVEAGSEFKAAISDAQERQIPYALIDQHYAITARRLSDELGLFGLTLLYLSSWLIKGVVFVQSKEDVVEFIENMKTKKDKDPSKTSSLSSLLHERDVYMVDQLKSMGRYKNILVVVGAKHLHGMEKHLKDM